MELRAEEVIEHLLVTVHLHDSTTVSGTSSTKENTSNRRNVLVRAPFALNYTTCHGSVDVTHIMSKRPQAPSQPQGPQPKHIHMEGKFEQANTQIHGLVQQLSQVQSGLPLLVSSLLIVFMRAPPEACMRATPSGYEIEELLKDNPDLQKALQDAIDQGRYEDVMSLCGYLGNIYWLSHSY